jgi:flagellar biosynthesis/type III secretory pathway chaperone
MSINKNDMLVFGLQVDELDAIEDDIRLYYEKYRFFYAVDSYDFVHFFLPYLDHLHFKKENIPQVAREGIAYESFFSPSKDGYILLMDEYKKELRRVEQVFIKRIHNSLELSNNIAQLSTKIRDQIDSGQTLEELVRENFEIFFLLLIFCQRKTEAKEVDFLKFLRRRVFVDAFQTEDENFNDYADAAFSSNGSDGFAKILMHAFVDQQFDALNKMGEVERFRILENTKEDIKAIEKILSANERISTVKEHGNTVFYYLSSTPLKSKVLFKLIHDLFGKNLSFLDKFKHKEKSIHRNIMQVFLFNMLVKEYPKSAEMPLKILSLVRDIQNIEPAQEGAYMEEVEAMDALTLILNKYTSLIENHIYNSFIINYNDSLVEMLQEVANEKSSFRNTLEMIRSAVEENKKQAELTNFNYDVKKFSQIVFLAEAINKRSEKNISKVKIRFGKDILRFNYHHLPYLLFVYDKNARGRYESYYNAMLEISSIDTREENYIEQVIRFLQDLFNRNESVGGVKRKVYGFLMHCYIDFLDIHIEGEETVENVEPALIDSLEMQLLSMGAFKTPVAGEAGDEGQSSVSENIKRESMSVKAARVEVYYVLTWLYRRQNRYEKLNFIQEQIKKEHLDDARIFHGLGIGYTSWFYYHQEQPEDTHMLDNAISYLIHARKGYSHLLQTVSEQNVRDLISRNIIGVCNSLADAYIRLYSFSKNARCVVSAREAIDVAKDYADSQRVYDSLAIINNTEAELEYYEALILCERNEYKISSIKLNHAIRRYKKSIAKEATEIHERWKKLSEKLDELKNKLRDPKN